ncbi:endolytic transglycosylase MltG [uncultured Clostridium sp.]|uniref:endolytic transglycosylase MltG n=1 Tax=uncultured Clostridium sp. TaxID=59620 RepID=UPI003217F040
MKKIVGIVVIVLIAILTASGFYYIYATKSPLKGDEVTIVVNEGDSLYNILDRLDNQGLVKNKTLTKVYMKLHNTSVELVPGTFKVSGKSSFEEIIAILENKNNEGSISVTIPEGYDIEKMAILFEEKGLFTKDEFLKAVKEYPAPDYIPAKEGRRYDLEGFLFPDTYFFNLGAKPNEVIATMNNAFNSKIKSIIPEGTNVYDIITIASLIENETRVDEERPLVSSVIYNRLKKEMKLQIDATVIYALGEHVDTVLNKHLEVDSPYNTYKNDGLPLGPISSPGISSILAAAKPESTDYLFYVLEKDKTHHYFTDNDVDFMNKLKELGY